MFRDRWSLVERLSSRPIPSSPRSAKPLPKTRLHLEEFEPRVTPSCGVGVASRVLTVNCDSSVNTVNYDDNGVNTNVNGVIISDSTFNTFQVNIGTGGGTVNLLEAVHVGAVSEVGTGNVTVNVSPTLHNLDSIAPLTITGGSGFDALVVNDQSNLNPHTYTLTATSVSRGNPINFGTLMNTVTLNGGSGSVTDVYNVFGTGGINQTTLNLNAQSDTVNVENTTHPLTVHETGSDFIAVSPSAQNLNNIQGPINVVVGGVNGIVLNVHDQNNTTNRTYGMTANSISRQGAATISFPTLLNDVALSGGSGTNVYNITGSPALFLTALETGGGNDIVNVESTRVATQLSINEQGSGNDFVNVCHGGHNLNAIQGTINVEGNAGNSALNVDDQNNTFSTTYTMTAGSITRPGSAAINFGVSGSHLDSVRILGGAGADTYNVAGTGALVSNEIHTSIATSATDVVNILATTRPLTVFLDRRGDTVNVSSSAHNLNTIQGNVAVIISTPSGTLNVDDQGNTSAALTYTLTDNSVTRTGAALISYSPLFQIVVNGATETAGNTYNVTGTSASSFTTLNLNNGGSSGHDVVNVQATSGPLTVNGPSFGETVNVGNAGSVQSIQGQLFLSRAGNLVINDGNDSSPRNVRLGTSVGDGIISGLAPANIEYDAIDIHNITVNGGTGGNTFNVQATVTNGLTPVTIVNSGAGNDTINVGDSINTLNEILSPVIVNGEFGFDTLNINDQGSAVPHHYFISSTNVTRSPGGPTIVYSDIESLNVHPGLLLFGPRAGASNNTIAVDSTAAGTATTIDDTPGDSVAIGNANNTLGGIQGNVNIAGAGDTTLTLNGQGGVVPQTYTIMSAMITRPGIAPINYSGVQTLTFNGGSGGNTWEVESTSLGTVTTINEGPDADIYDIAPTAQDLSTLNGDVVINGSGTNVVNVYDNANTGPGLTYTLTASSLTRTGAPTVFFSQSSDVNLFGSNGSGETYNVSATGASDLTTIFGGNAGNAYNIDGTTFALTINGGTGGDRLNLTPDVQNLAAIAGPLAFNSNAPTGTGIDSIYMYDGSSVDNYSVSDFSTTSAGLGGNFNYTGQSAIGGFDGLIVLFTDPTSGVTNNTTLATLEVNPPSPHGGPGNRPGRGQSPSPVLDLGLVDAFFLSQRHKPALDWAAASDTL